MLHPLFAVAVVLPNANMKEIAAAAEMKSAFCSFTVHIKNLEPETKSWSKYQGLEIYLYHTIKPYKLVCFKAEKN